MIKIEFLFTFLPISATQHTGDPGSVMTRTEVVRSGTSIDLPLSETRMGSSVIFNAVSADSCCFTLLSNKETSTYTVCHVSGIYDNNILLLKSFIH